MTSTQKMIKTCAIVLAIIIILAIVNGTLFFLHILGGYSYQKGDINIKENYENVLEIDIDLAVSNLIIQKGEKLEVNAQNVNSSFTSKVTNGKLKIKEGKKQPFQYNKGTIYVNIPQNANLDKMDISTGAGKVEISNLIVRELEIDQGAGLLFIENSNSQKTDIKGGAGEIKILQSILEDLDLECGVGKVSLDGEILGVSKIESGIGEINLDLGEQENYSIYVEKGLGSIKVDGEELPSGATKGEGRNRVRIEGGLGSIKINFKE